MVMIYIRDDRMKFVTILCIVHALDYKKDLTSDLLTRVFLILLFYKTMIIES